MNADLRRDASRIPPTGRQFNIAITAKGIAIRNSARTAKRTLARRGKSLNSMTMTVKRCAALPESSIDWRQSDARGFKLGLPVIKRRFLRSNNRLDGHRSVRRKANSRRCRRSRTPFRREVPSLTPGARSDSNRNFKLFCFGQSISVIGTWMTRLATTWLVYRLTHFRTSARRGQLLRTNRRLRARPVRRCLGRAPRDRRKLLVWTQFAGGALQSLALAALTLHTRIINLWEIIALASLVARRHQRVRHALTANLFTLDANGRRPRRPQQRHRHQLFDGQLGAPRLIGPAIAGLSDRRCRRRLVRFLIDGVRSYFTAVIASLLAMRITPAEARAAAPPPCSSKCAKGWDYRLHLPPRFARSLLVFLVDQPDGLSLRQVLLPDFRGANLAWRRAHARLAFRRGRSRARSPLAISLALRQNSRRSPRA